LFFAIKSFGVIVSAVLKLRNKAFRAQGGNKIFLKLKAEEFIFRIGVDCLDENFVFGFFVGSEIGKTVSFTGNCLGNTVGMDCVGSG